MKKVWQFRKYSYAGDFGFISEQSISLTHGDYLIYFEHDNGFEIKKFRSYEKAKSFLVNLGYFLLDPLFENQEDFIA